jgi:hypothetical protein
MLGQQVGSLGAHVGRAVPQCGVDDMERVQLELRPLA